MKITKEQLRQIIKEERIRLLFEGSTVQRSSDWKKLVRELTGASLMIQNYDPLTGQDEQQPSFEVIDNAAFISQNHVGSDEIGMIIESSIPGWIEMWEYWRAWKELLIEIISVADVIDALEILKGTIQEAVATEKFL